MRYMPPPQRIYLIKWIVMTIKRSTVVIAYLGGGGEKGVPWEHPFQCDLFSVTQRS